MSIAIGAVAATIAAIPVLSALLSRPKRSAGVWVGVGSVDAFRVGETVKVTYRDPEAVSWEGYAAESAAWLRRETDERFVAFSVHCTHVGCPVRWLEGAELFLCPCHGGAFHRDGAVAGGPPPRPLPRHPVRIRRGRVEVLSQPVYGAVTS